jgi:hypothetical protein
VSLPEKEKVMAQPSIRLVRAAPEPLGLFLRVGHNGHKDVQTFISSGDAAIGGVVIEAKRLTRHKELLSLVLERSIDAILDPQTQAMGTVGGYSSSMDGLPWSAKRPHTPSDFSTEFSRHKLADEVAQFAVTNGFTQVLAPTHLIAGPDDDWFDVDLATATALRGALLRRGAAGVQVNYSLALTYEAFRNPTKRQAVLNRLRGTQMDSLWLHIDGCGSDSSPTAATRYGDAAVEFQSLGVPIIADHMGGLVGLALLAFGTVGGLCHGITQGEQFHCGHWRKRSEGEGFTPPVRVYLPSLDMLLARDDAEKFFETGGKARTAFGCKNTACCSRGIQDMLQSPARHFMYQRTREVAGLAQVPESLRPQHFMEEHLRPASDKAVLATTQLTLPDALSKRMSAKSKRLDELRVVLSDYAQKRRDMKFAQHPKTRAAREPRR